jgi:hypothetical protein
MEKETTDYRPSRSEKALKCRWLNFLNGGSTGCGEAAAKGCPQIAQIATDFSKKSKTRILS